MNPYPRWAKFNLVGVMGMGVQLLALAFFARMLPGHSLCATAAAIEVTVLHNFVWHTRYTWRDRSGQSPCLRQLVRFHLSNGLVSLLGNLVLMRLLMHNARLPLPLANLVAILVCSIANFSLGNRWAFGEERSTNAVSECSPSDTSSMRAA